MAEIDTNMVLDGITLALRAAYPSSLIGDDEILQGLIPPAFIVHLASASQAARASKRWRRSPRFDIIYFPEEKREECYTVADDLCEILEIITLPSGDKLRGTNMDFEVVDGVLHFLVSYNHFVYKSDDEISMENFKLQQGEF